MTACSMLKDKNVAKYIRPYGVNGFRIPNITAFAEHALPNYFPDQNQVFMPCMPVPGDIIL